MKLCCKRLAHSAGIATVAGQVKGKNIWLDSLDIPIIQFLQTYFLNDSMACVRVRSKVNINGA